jgi:hypothetical protein
MAREALSVPATKIFGVRPLELLGDKTGKFAVGKSKDVDLIRIGNLATRGVGGGT